MFGLLDKGLSDVRTFGCADFRMCGLSDKGLSDKGLWDVQTRGFFSVGRLPGEIPGTESPLSDSPIV